MQRGKKRWGWLESDKCKAAASQHLYPWNIFPLLRVNSRGQQLQIHCGVFHVWNALFRTLNAFSLADENQKLFKIRWDWLTTLDGSLVQEKLLQKHNCSLKAGTFSYCVMFSCCSTRFFLVDGRHVINLACTAWLFTLGKNITLWEMLRLIGANRNWNNYWSN